MIEVIYKDEKQEAKGNEGIFSVPRNIRQIGLIDEDYKIYVEDYVYTFLGKAAEACREAEAEKGCVAVLTGETKWSGGTTYVFVKGALLVEEMDATAEHIDFTEEIWRRLQEEGEKFFKGQEVVGWFFAQQQLPLEITEVFKRVHLKHFGGGEKILMLMEPTEREDAFFRYENGFMIKQSGYYLYYEKNPLMQAYMLEKKHRFDPEPAEKVDDEAVKAFRKIIKGKKKNERPETEEKTSVFSYAATACLAIAVLAVGGRLYQNYRALNTMKQQVSEVSSVMEADNKDKTAATPSVTLSVTPSVMPTRVPSVTPAPSVTPKISPTVTPVPSEGPSEETYSRESDLRKERINQEDASLEQQTEESAETAQDQVGSQGEVHSSYVIRPGDTLYQISMEKYGTMEAISEICRLNGLSAEEIIYPGQIIVLP